MIGIIGSVKRTAVAGTVLGSTNVPISSDEKVDTITAPFTPATRDDTSAATAAF